MYVVLTTPTVWSILSVPSLRLRTNSTAHWEQADSTRATAFKKNFFIYGCMFICMQKHASYECVSGGS